MDLTWISSNIENILNIARGTSRTFFPKIFLCTTMNNSGNGQGGFIKKKNSVGNL